MTDTYNNFIGIYRNACPERYCEHLIAEFENRVAEGAGYNRQQKGRMYAAKHEKDDLAISFNAGMLELANFEGHCSREIFFQTLQKGFEAYTEQFSVLKNSRINGNCMKIQKTTKGGGYHVWHAEQNDGDQANRVLVYSLYLNTLPENGGGETEFLYQQERIPAVENTLLIWPAAFTHAHRGNLVLSDEPKYIVTGWFYYE
jgi:hypothetical protein